MTRRAAVAGDVAARRAIVAFLVSSSDADRHAILRLSDRRHFEVQTPDPDLIEHPGPPHRTAKHQTARPSEEKKTSEDAVAISPLPPHYHRRIQRGRRCHVEHPKNCLRKGKALQACRVGTTPPHKSVGRVGNRWIAALTFSSSLFSCLPAAKRLVHLEKDREILRDQWKYGLETRDLRIEEYRRALAKQGK